MSERTKTNRVLLALLGLVLLGGGLLVLAGGTDVYRRWNLTPPAGWPLTTAHHVLVPSADQTRWTELSWWWPAVIAVLALLMLLALTWLLSQRRRRPRQLSVGAPPEEAVAVSNHALSDALTAGIDTLPGVRGSHTHLYGPRTHPQAPISITLSPGTSPEQILEGLHEAVERARASAGWNELPTRVRLSVARHSPNRVE
ncbi:alkaline shock response membrane anchor protein AmaP [Streptomyces sp. NPDC048248]|uniref:alkaline shock response membrane anchor protein AmaP n=1 Tax=Streptomyces sp. NPDC048248 TaxID=3365523 RepID=UPI00371879F8